MKKSFTMVLCFAFVACVLVGCGRTENMKTTDTTTTPSISTAPITTNSTMPMTDATQPSITSSVQDAPETSSMPSDETNRADNNREPETPRSRTHYPSVIDRMR